MLDLALMREQLFVLAINVDRAGTSVPACIESIQVRQGRGEAVKTQYAINRALSKQCYSTKICANRKSELRSLTAARPCARDAANRYLPAASIAALD